jgi:predicted RNA binding protein YcfA (HicA-like mRNA interferase family)
LLLSDLVRDGPGKEAMKVRDVIKLIEADGWYLAATKGSHRQYKHPTKPGRVTIAGHPGDDLAPGTLNSVLKQAQLAKGRAETGE